ncbi:MAG: cbb3-type cytochrome c oxidase subunit I [Gemmatimonadetes bacterium]|nr:cbb3-type cytochrome c oxidase subunit I [Gemmatimonadota bacterium]
MSDETLTTPGVAPPPTETELDARLALQRTWWRDAGPLRWLREVDHKAIGLRVVFTALTFFLLAGILAALMRTQLARPEHGILGPDRYDQVFTVHGTTMMFLFAVPVMMGLGLYFVPLMVGTRNIAYPRLCAYAYFVYLIGSLFLWISLLTNTGPDVGWFAYTPLSGPEYGIGKRPDVWAQTITFTEISMMAFAVSIIVTIFKQRAPGMSLNRMPMFVWTMLVTSFMVLFAMTTIATASIFLASDRLVGTHFFNPAEGGDPLLWQHLFWYFGHPEVYIIFLPGTGMVSLLVTAFARRELFGYTALVLATIATGFLGYGVWVHHMFATGLPQLGESFFTGSSLLITIPNGLQIFCWLATLWSGKLRVRAPLLFVFGFFFILVRGGLTGVMVASVAFDLQVHDTFFIVAHLHDVLIGGAVFPLLGAILFWWPKWTGRLTSERLGRASFWLIFLGENLTFVPMYVLGLRGMPRRQYTYLAASGWGPFNLLASAGAALLALGVLVYLANLVVSTRAGAPAGDDPWDADTLDWATSSPPPAYNFLRIPVVQGRYALWSRTADAPVVTGLALDRREVLVTSTLDATPQLRYELPGPTIWPFLAALGTGVTWIFGVFTPWGIVVGLALTGPALVAWGWPRRRRATEVRA